MEATSSPVDISHILVEASPADIIYLPLGENLAELPECAGTPFVCPVRAFHLVPDANSQISITLPSLPDDKAYLPSGEKSYGPNSFVTDEFLYLS